VFSVGSLEFAPTKGAALVSPFQLANGSGCAVGDDLSHVLQIIFSLDADDDPDNGVQLPELPATNPSHPVSQLGNGDIEAAILAERSDATVVSADVALDRFIRQVDDELWEEPSDTDFLLPDALYRGQGVATDGTSWFFSATNHLQRTNQAFESQVDNADPLPLDIFKLGGNHIGDIDVLDGKLYAPIEDGPDYLNPYIVTYDAETLEPTGESFLLPQELLTEGVPWVAVDGPRRRVYTAEWNPTERINVFFLDDGLKLDKTIELSSPIGRIQGAKVFGGAMYASSDNDDKSIYKIDLDTGTVMKLFALDTPASESEGLALTADADGAHIHVLNVVVPKVVFSDRRRTRDPLRDSICP
jgi:hypothetical protein